MAERLSDVEYAQGSNITRPYFLEFIQRIEDLDDELLNAQETVRSIRRRIKDAKKTASAEGLNVPMAMLALADSKRSGEEREADNRQYRMYMLFFAKPVGFQPSLDFDAADEGLAALNDRELNGIEDAGLKAGRDGDRRTRNPWSPGTEPYVVWDNGWLAGQAEIASSLAENGAANDSNGTGRRRRGRPRRSEQVDDQPAPAA